MKANMDQVFELLQKTAQDDPLAVAMLDSKKKNNVFERISDEIGDNHESYSDNKELLELIMEGMAQYINSRETPPSLRQKPWNTCNAWIGRIAKELNTRSRNTFEDYCPQPVAIDTRIALIKALHSEKAKTKSDLAAEVGVSEKTIQSNLRALCPALQQSGKPASPIRIGGQEVHAVIREEAADQNDYADERPYKAYRMADRLHPLVLQLNTIQTAHLLMALQSQNDANKDIVCYETALDVWCQLSEEGKERIREVYCTRSRVFRKFIEDIDSECEEGRLAEFHKEETLWENLDRKSLLESTFKNGAAVSMKLNKDGRLIELNNVRLRWGEHGGDDWLAIPNVEWPREEHAVRFASKDICGQIEIVE